VRRYSSSLLHGMRTDPVRVERTKQDLLKTGGKVLCTARSRTRDLYRHGPVGRLRAGRVRFSLFSRTGDLITSPSDYLLPSPYLTLLRTALLLRPPPAPETLTPLSPLQPSLHHASWSTGRIGGEISTAQDELFRTLLFKHTKDEQKPVSLPASISLEGQT
jgi:hypothetical protein